MSIQKATIEYTPFFIGTIAKEGGGFEKFWTGLAKDHASGRLTNKDLLAMSSEQLEEIAFSKDEKTVYGEMYVAPDDSKEAEKQGFHKGEEYFAPHRAVIILQYRKAKRLFDMKHDPDFYLKNLIPQPEVKDNYSQAVGSLLKKAMNKQEDIKEPDWCEQHHCFTSDCDMYHDTVDRQEYD